ncbi:MAG: T9SS type A sorting domain-containing protein [Bacteroidetes bacterium]|nr:T9SS type A sorting domain-containing protein [Bacteroidota bacterium]
MKKLIIVFCVLFLLQFNEAHLEPLLLDSITPYFIIRTQSGLNANNISTWVWNSGVFNQDLRTTNTSGFQWPKGSGKFAIYTAGLTIGAYINNNLRLAAISYNGEYGPGYIVSGVALEDSTFKVYKVNKGDNSSNNSDYANWGRMVPYGAPYLDVNNNGVYDAGIDKPGVQNAAQTIFECITDGFPDLHSTSEGFYGGTLPLYSEMHLTAWCYDNINGLSDVQFLKMEILNKSDYNWEKTYFGIVCDPDLGDSHDDFTGCDSNRNLGYCYNADNMDGNGIGATYGANPPAVGYDFLRSAVNKHVFPNVELRMSSFHFYQKESQPSPPCENEILNSPVESYNYLTGAKKDLTPFINPLTMHSTKFVYSGDPETDEGWTQHKGKINNCGGALSGPFDTAYAGEIRFVMSSGADNLTIFPNEKQTFVIAQMIARGTSNLNSVTKLKQLDDYVQTVYDNNFAIGIRPISNDVPDKFSLFQNYPNPFNPSTKIKFEIAKSDFVNLTVFDLSGKVVEQLVNEKLNEGIYEVNFTAKNISSGIYFYRLSTDNFTQTNRMILVK